MTTGEWILPVFSGTEVVSNGSDHVVASGKFLACERGFSRSPDCSSAELRVARRSAPRDHPAGAVHANRDGNRASDSGALGPGGIVGSWHVSGRAH